MRAGARNGPEIAVVIPTRDRAARLASLLDALRAQTLDRERFEAVVVDDGSTDETAELLRAEREVEALALAVVDGRGAGPAAARNLGWRHARAPLVAFTDDDCEPTAAWLERLLEAAGGGGGGIVQGPTRPAPGELHRLGPYARTKSIEAPGPWYQTCNICYPRAVLERLGGFDERFPEPLGEDTDLGWRARELGLGLDFAPEALVHHAVEEVGPAAQLRFALRGADAAWVYRRHPELRRETARYGFFWNENHALLLLAQIGRAHV